jgi:hypothetical protein
MDDRQRPSVAGVRKNLALQAVIGVAQSLAGRL